MSTSARTRAVHAARRQLLERHELRTDLLPDAIARSWARCVQHGFDAHRAPILEPLSETQLREVRERHDALTRLARPALTALEADARTTGSVVLLANQEGLILESVGSSTFASRAARVALRPGVPWNEASTGTNAIGGALLELAPLVVHGEEHFFEGHRTLTCAAAPIRDGRGRVLGVLDLSGHAATAHDHALGLVQLAVDQIEHRWFDEVDARSEVLRFHADAALLGTPQEGVLVLEHGRLVGANRHALALTGLSWDSLARTAWGEVLRADLRRGRDVQAFRLQSGAMMHGTFRGETRPSARGVTVPLGAPAPAVRTAERIGTPRAVFQKAALVALDRAVRLVDHDVPVLVHGETGTGKELFAREVHDRSRRRHRPFVAINCAAIPEGLIESELFGYVEGAFTGARRQGARGLLREADGGVVFFDELGDMPLPLQARLLRVLQEREVVPLGGTRPVPVDVAVISATHRNLPALVEEGGFRGDLYYRLAQYTIELQPLRTFDDVRGVVRGAWDDLRGSAADLLLTPACEAALAAYEWPGNFRQLASTLRALRVLADPGVAVDVDALAPDIRHAASVPTPRPQATPSPRPATRGGGARETGGSLQDVTREAMRAALDAHGGNVTRAARALGINRSTLYRKLAL